MLGEFPRTLPMLCALAGGGSAQMVCRRFVEGLERAKEHYFSLLGLMLKSLFPIKMSRLNVLYLCYTDLCQNALNPFRGCIGFAWQGFGSRGATGVASVRSC